MALLSPLDDEARTTFLVVALPEKRLRTLVGRLGTAPKGKRIDAMNTWDLAWSLVDYYTSDPEVGSEVDRTLQRELGAPRLAAFAAESDSAMALVDLLVRAKDPLRDGAWALLCSKAEGTAPLVTEIVGAIIAEYDEAEERHKEEDAARQAATTDSDGSDPEARRLEDEADQARRESARAAKDRERALHRIEQMRARIVELEGALGQAREDVRRERATRDLANGESTQLRVERDDLKRRLGSATPAEVARLGRELDGERRRADGAERDLEESAAEEARLRNRVRELESQRPESSVASPLRADPTEGEGPGWSVPVFTDEFYESIRRWDRKIVRIAFEKVARLAEDWRHGSLRAIPLEGVPDLYRIRIASDVRLIYRPLDGNRVEILALIDREDLQRYVRQSKTR